MAPLQHQTSNVLPAQHKTTIHPDGRVLLRIPECGTAIETTPPVSIPAVLHRAAQKFGDVPALVYKQDGNWITINYKDYLQQVRICAKAFLHLGLERYHSVCILGFNSPEWFIADLGAIFAGGFACGIYTTNSSEACHYVADSSRANIIVVEDEKQLEKILAIKSKLPHLKHIVQYTGSPVDPQVLSWKRLMEIGSELPDDQLDDILENIGVNECCTLVYTSGTIGNPKAVMLSHDNLTFDALSISERIGVQQGCEVLVSYLPLSHVAAQVVDIHITMACGATIYFADKNALKGSLVNTLKEARPTKFLAVPRVWEKIYEKMMQVRAESGALKKVISGWARGHTLQHHLDRIKGINSKSWSYSLASALIFSKVKQALGLDRCTIFASAAAPLSSEIKRYFMSIDIPIMEAFGMSEASGAHTLCANDEFGLETIGKTLPGMKTKLHNVDEDNQGELCMYGRHVFMGYLNDEEKTDESIDSDGWLHTGDLGTIDDKGFVYITGRLKELIITAGGENVPPVPIEQMIKAELPHVSNAFLVGDRRKFLSVLLSFKTEVDSEGRPLDTLLPTVQEWLKELGCPATTITQLLAAGPDQRLLDALHQGIDRVNQQATSNAQRIQKLTILPADFSVQTGELGPTLKMRRNVVLKKYEDLIDQMYK